MRIKSPIMTIAVGQANSQGIDVGNAIVCGVVFLTVGAETADYKIQELISGNLGQGNEVWSDVSLLADDGTAANVIKVADAAIAANKAYTFDVTRMGLLAPVLRLASTANITTTPVTAYFMLQPRG